VVAQLRETFDNFDSLLGAARAADSRIEPAFGAHSLLKVYLRDAAALPELQAALARLLPNGVPRLILQGDICRRELAVEIDGFHG
jgi:chorismate lyase/3-hydroxybenzoate synthase